MKLKSIENENNPDAAIAKLTEKVKELKAQRFRCIFEIKVKPTLSSSILVFIRKLQGGRFGVL